MTTVLFILKKEWRSLLNERHEGLILFIKNPAVT